MHGRVQTPDRALVRPSVWARMVAHGAWAPTKEWRLNFLIITRSKFPKQRRTREARTKLWISQPSEAISPYLTSHLFPTGTISAHNSYRSQVPRKKRFGCGCLFGRWGVDTLGPKYPTDRNDGQSLPGPSKAWGGGGGTGHRRPTPCSPRQVPHRTLALDHCPFC